MIVLCAMYSTERRLMSFAILVCRIRLFVFCFFNEKGNGDGQTTTIEMEWNAKHNLWLGFMFRTRGGGWVVYLR